MVEELVSKTSEQFKKKVRINMGRDDYPKGTQFQPESHILPICRRLGLYPFDLYNYLLKLYKSNGSRIRGTMAGWHCRLPT